MPLVTYHFADGDREYRLCDLDQLKVGDVFIRRNRTWLVAAITDNLVELRLPEELAEQAELASI